MALLKVLGGADVLAHAETGGTVKIAVERMVPTVRRHWPLMLFLTGLFGWIDGLPLYGPAGTGWSAARGIAYGPLPFWFLGAHGLGLVLWGMLLDRRPHQAVAAAYASLVADGALTLALLRLPGSDWPAVFAAMGVVTAAGVVAWGRWYATTVDGGWLGRIFAAAAAGVAMTKWTMEKLVLHLPPAATLVGTLVLLAAAGAGLARLDTAVHPRRQSLAPPARGRATSVARIALFIGFFSLVAGLSYQVIVVRPLTPYIDDGLRLLPYVGGILTCGVLADRRSLQTSLVAGASLLALAFLFSAWGSPAAQYLGLGLNGIAFGLLEPTPWLLLAANATQASAGRWFGWGLNLNVVPIFLGAFVTARLRGLDPQQVGLLAAVVIVLAMASLYGVRDPLTPLHELVQDRAVAVSRSLSLDELWDRRYTRVLSPRELEVGRLAVHGFESADIAQRLHISENTVKTHLRHVYRKTASTNRADLLRKLVRTDDGRD